MSLVKLSIKEFHTVKHRWLYAILNEVDGENLPIVIGAFEAQSIITLEKIKPPSIDTRFIQNFGTI
jgi:bifunctional DNase/RNase